MDEKCCYQLEKPRKRQREGSKRKSTSLNSTRLLWRTLMINLWTCIRRLKLYAPQLLNFKLSGSELLNIDVVAPRLESFILEPDYPSCDLVYVMQNQLCCVAIPLRCVGRFESFWSRSCLPLRD
ncbi:hypothetical protein LINPERHAP2_LOCUS34150 [Linum perenne]